ncbi:MAG: SGNH/GDSL hydrolase family protein [bacterium]|nr:SGNH/GDSL hydrolase family protein [bacterium]MDT8365293.1 SGNH/GDSL hydrolase family protein [bacterium]
MVPKAFVGGRIQKYMGLTYAGRFVEYAEQTLKPLLMTREKTEEYHTKWMRTAVRYWKDDANRESLMRQLGQFKEEMSNQRIPFTFLIFPERNDLQHPDAYSLPREAITDMLRQLDINYCDAYGAFAAEKDVDSLFLAGDSVHYTPEGHSVIKDVLLSCGQAGIVQVSPVFHAESSQP